MSLYREPGRERRRRRMIATGAIVAVAAIALIVVLVAGGGGGTPSASERASSAREAAGQALDRLELLEIEYDQAIGSKAAATELTGAIGHIEAARKVVEDHAADLRAVDVAAFATAQQALRRVSDGVDAKVPIATLRLRIATARRSLRSLARPGG